MKLEIREKDEKTGNFGVALTRFYCLTPKVSVLFCVSREGGELKVPINIKIQTKYISD